uniref:NADH-ubiquinone oxidoreductase chain 2 n=1 Tax=Indotyphlops braminus TaxID=51846 RepID=Q5EX59_9SAUR|nr:NADH dehydrogenase subunit 2 [Indotyphlops braminus]AAW72022.1 NADH dehydrogenase subunit 2 [Indotyphlops braminus]ABC55918.1 NADH dehydrogenase subunit 2 [Indotyphlops braminus]
MSPISALMMTTSIILGTLITASSKHWLMAWVGLEMNTLAIIPLIAKPHHPRAMEATTKYFLTQAMASAMILFAATMNASNTGQWEIKDCPLQTSTMILSTALLMKLGSAPFHFWVPEVLQGSQMKTGLVILTWQKLAPMALILSMGDALNQKVLITSAIFSILLGGWGGLNQTQLRKLMAFSSISHMGWILLTVGLAPKTSAFALMVYILLTTPLFLSMLMLQSKTIKDVGTAWNSSTHTSSIMLLTLMSIAGLPPMTGFAPKWLILKELTHHSMILLATTAAILSTLSLFFYLHLSYSTAMTTPPNTVLMTQKWRFFPKKHSSWFPLLASTTILLLPLTPALL